MKKIYKNINDVNFNKHRYNKIMESIRPEIKKMIREKDETDDEDKDKDKDDDINDDIEEQVLNELLDFGSSNINKPEKALSLENSDKENAELVIQWCAYFMAQAENNVKKGLDEFLKQFGKILIKIPKLITKGVLMLLSDDIKNADKYSGTTVASIILSIISMLVKFVNSGIENAKQALSNLYQIISKGLNAFYNWFIEKATNAIISAKEKVELWLGIFAGALMAVANKITGATETFGELLKKIIQDAKDKKDSAVLLTKTWLSAKSKEIKDWIFNINEDIKTTVVKAWNSMDKKVRKTYDNIASKLEDWMKDIKELVSFITGKIGDKADFVMDKNDKALIWDIQKGIKGLSKNYTEDQLVALVRKCYNENLIPDIRGNYYINEEYFYKPNTKIRTLYENKKISRKKSLY